MNKNYHVTLQGTTTPTPLLAWQMIRDSEYNRKKTVAENILRSVGMCIQTKLRNYDTRKLHNT